mmetsp:Transcript_17732/g.62142  ORF Transcript_17732/g.62142 Transcript_17732/m.62142 type:complete len:283 (-) Transcript_17732:931-1779(-)
MGEEFTSRRLSTSETHVSKTWFKRTWYNWNSFSRSFSSGPTKLTNSLPCALARPRLWMCSKGEAARSKRNTKLQTGTSMPSHSTDVATKTFTASGPAARKRAMACRWVLRLCCAGKPLDPDPALTTYSTLPPLKARSSDKYSAKKRHVERRFVKTMALNSSTDWRAELSRSTKIWPAFRTLWLMLPRRACSPPRACAHDLNFAAKSARAASRRRFTSPLPGSVPSKRSDSSSSPSSNTPPPPPLPAPPPALPPLGPPSAKATAPRNANHRPISTVSSEMRSE